MLTTAHVIKLTVYSKESTAVSSGKVQDTPQYYVNSLKVEHSVETLRSLLVVLRSQPISWLKQFCDCGGVETMLEILSGLQMVTEKKYFAPPQTVLKLWLTLTNNFRSEAQTQMENEIIRAIKVIMNNKVGLEMAIHTKGSMKTIASCLASTSIDRKSREMVLELLTVVCLVPATSPNTVGGHE
jgi:cytokinesis protein